MNLYTSEFWKSAGFTDFIISSISLLSIYEIDLFVFETSDRRQAIIDKAIRKTRWLNVMVGDWINSYRKDANDYSLHDLIKELNSSDNSHDIFKNINAIIDEVKNFIR